MRPCSPWGEHTAHIHTQTFIHTTSCDFLFFIGLAAWLGRTDFDWFIDSGKEGERVKGGLGLWSSGMSYLGNVMEGVGWDKERR